MPCSWTWTHTPQLPHPATQHTRHHYPTTPHRQAPLPHIHRPVPHLPPHLYTFIWDTFSPPLVYSMADSYCDLGSVFCPILLFLPLLTFCTWHGSIPHGCHSSICCVLWTGSVVTRCPQDLSRCLPPPPPPPTYHTHTPTPHPPAFPRTTFLLHNVNFSIPYTFLPC